ncbi:MAG: HU family DNA-binding protein [Bacteroidales bacterium]|nr:HU family DNA-binding protein [Candidatus Equimonas enterica]
MTNKEFISTIAARTDMSADQVQACIDALTSAIADNLEEGDALAVQGFGTFEVKKKLERVVVNPNTKQRMLVPPKLTINFRPSNTLKDKTR